MVLSLCALLLLASPQAPSNDSAVGEVNTLWVIPEQNLAWVEPLYAKRRPGGGLYTIGGFVAQRDLADSIAAALRWLAKHPEDAPGFDRLWRKHDLYFSWPDPEQPRGGPSAGVAFAVASYSALLDLPVRRDVAFTGGVDASGKVLSIGGLAAKEQAALTAGMKVLCVPADGAPRPESIPVGVARRLRLVVMTHAEEAFFEAFGLHGPEAVRYDRMQTLYHDAFAAISQRREAAARLALDELCELVPNDLSAMRLQSLYRNVDMRPLAANLFADAEQYERDGLPDEALKAARRGWSYADAATREAHQAQLERLERANLPPAVRTMVDQARDFAQQGEVGQAYRLIQEALLREPHHPYVQQQAQAWTKYGAVAALERVVDQRPDDIPSRVALARALLVAGVPRRAAELFADLRRRDPAQVGWALEQAQALAAFGRLDQAAGVLREVLRRWPEPVSTAAKELGLKLEPPSLAVTPWTIHGRLATATVTSRDPAGPPTLTILLDDRPQATWTGGQVRLEVDLGRLKPGPLALELRSADRYNNTAALPLALTAPPRADGPCLQQGTPPAVPAGTWAPAPDSRVVCLAGTTLMLDGAGWFAGSGSVAEVKSGDAAATTPPFRLSLPVTAGPDRRVEVTAKLRPGPSVTRTMQVEGRPQPPLWLLAPAADTELVGTVDVQVASPEPLVGRVVLSVDGRPRAASPTTQPLRLDPAGLAPGAHELTAAVELADGRLVLSPPVAVQVPVPARGPLGEADPDPLPTTATALTAVAETPDAALQTLQPLGAVRFEPAEPTVTAMPGPTTGQAIWLDNARLPGRALELALGDAVALASLRDPAVLGPSPKLVRAPFATVAWQPPSPGTWWLDLPGGPTAVTVTASPGLALLGPPAPCRLLAPTRFDPQVAADVALERVSLLDGDRPLATWPGAPPPFRLDPARLAPGVHLLRLIGVRRDGGLVISPVVVAATG